MSWVINIIAAAVSLIVGVFVAAYYYGKQNRRETERLQREMHDNSVYYLQAVQTMERQIADKDEELRVKQRVLDSLNEDVNRLRRKADKRED